MRFLHTADWHLGRVLHGVSLLEDQAYVLDRFVEMARDQKPDAILIAGDVYDRSIPPEDAVSLLNDTLARLVLGEKIPVVMIAGNHDSAARLGFGAKLLEPAGLHVFGKLGGGYLELGDTRIYGIPYADPAFMREAAGADIQTHDAGLAALTDAIRAKHPKDKRSVVVAHAFVAGGADSESERPLAVGGTGTVEATRFAGFDYVALGHLHRPQHVGRPEVRYSGSLLQYSGSEANHKKSITLIELENTTRIKELPLAPKRPLRVLDGTLDELLAAAPADPSRDDYIIARIRDKVRPADPRGRLVPYYANILHIERPHLGEAAGYVSEARDHRKHTELELFEAFFKEATSGEPAAEELDVFKQLLTEWRSEGTEPPRPEARP